MGPIKRLGERVLFKQPAAKRQQTKAAKVSQKALDKQVPLNNSTDLSTKKMTHSKEILSADLVKAEKLTGFFTVTYASGAKYEGDFVEGIPDGHGTTFWPNDNKNYVGEIHKKKIEGKGEEFWSDGKKRYSGNYQDGAYHGYGIAYDDQGKVIHDGYWFKGQKYVGEMKNDLPEGEGSLSTMYDYVTYKGHWKNGVRHGYGETSIYKGMFKNDLREGHGVEIWPHNQEKRYEGNWHKDEHHGQGTLHTMDGSPYYIGSWVNGEQHGQGIVYLSNGDTIEGYWYRGYRYEGNWRADKPEGNGSLFLHGDDPYYDGGFHKGEFHGEGKLYRLKYLHYEGGFKNGKFDGAGTLFEINGKVAQKGIWINGVFQG